MGRRLAYTLRERRAMCNTRYGWRPTNDWGSGRLPCPYAEGDIIQVGADCPAVAAQIDSKWSNDPETGRPTAANGKGYRRLPGGPGLYVAAYCTSIGEGDDWYIRLRSHDLLYCDRLHIIDGGRDGATNFMADTITVDTPDPDGLRTREMMLHAGWTFEKAKAAAGPCACCGCPTNGVHDR